MFFSRKKGKSQETLERGAEIVGRGIGQVILDSSKQLTLEMLKSKELNIDNSLKDRLTGELVLLDIYLHLVVFRNEIKNEEFREKLLNNLHREIIEKLKMPSDYYYQTINSYKNEYGKIGAETFLNIAENAPYIFIELLEGKNRNKYTSIEEYSSRWGHTIIFMKIYLANYIRRLIDTCKEIPT